MIMKKFLSLLLLALLTMPAWAQTTVTLTAEANALEDNTEFTFNGDAVVTLQSGNYLFLRDESGYGMIYGVVEGTFENGQVLTQGWNATKASVNGWVRYTDAAGLSASSETNAALAAPLTVTGIDESMLNAYVCYKNVTFNMFGRKIVLPDNTSISVYDLFGINMPGGFNDSRHWNVYGVISMQGTALKFSPIQWELYVEPTYLRGDVNGDGQIGIADVTALIDYLLTGDASAIILEAAECNEDGQVGIADATALIDYILKGTW